MAALSFGISAQADVSFTRQIAPILVKRCVACHGERTNLGGWRTHTFEFLRKAGASGKPSVVPGAPEKSRLFHLLTDKRPAVRMPQGDEPLPAAEIGVIRRWIAEGARFDGPDPSASIKGLLGPRKHPAPPAVYRVPAPVLVLAFTPDGREIAVGGYNEVLFWDSTTGALNRRIPGLPQRIHSVVFHPDGKRMLVAGGVPGEYGEVAMVDLASGKRRVVDTFPDLVLCAAISRDGSKIVAGCADSSVRCWDVGTTKTVWTSRVHSDWVTSIDFSSDGRFAASASKDHTVKVYDAATGALFTTYNGHNKQFGKYKGQFPVFAVRFLPDSDLAASGGGGPTVQVWDPAKAALETGTAADMEERFAKESHARHIEHGFKQNAYLVVIRNGFVFAASGDGVVSQFDLASGAKVRDFSGHTDWVYALDVDAAGSRAASGSYDGEIRIWDARTGSQTLLVKNQPGRRR